MDIHSMKKQILFQAWNKTVKIETFQLRLLCSTTIKLNYLEDLIKESNGNSAELPCSLFSSKDHKSS